MPYKTPLALCFVLLLLVTTALPCFAQTVYVSDNFRITLRNSPVQNAQINSMLSSGAKLEVLEETENWLRVRTEEDKTGWILKRFSMDRLPKAQVVERLRERIAELEQTGSKARKTVQELKEDNSRLASELESTNNTLSELRQDYQKLRNDVPNLPQIKEELEKTRNRLQNSLAQIEELKARNASLRSRKSQLWFLVGAGVVFISCFIGFLLGRIKRKKSRSVYF
ncbi:MAG: TIGR04211 family SH3 domain-containing protein [Desulfohalobiaceae bacterium]